MSKKKVIRFGLPKGSLEKPTIEKMAKAGFNVRSSSRSLVPYVDDPEIEVRLIRALRSLRPREVHAPKRPHHER